jgi:hypothetical protein
MPEPKSATPERAFVSRDLRPALLGQIDAPPMLPQDAAPEELRRLADEALCGNLRTQLDWAASSGSSPAGASPARYLPEPHVASTRMEEETVLLDLRGGAYYTLNRVGTAVWDLLHDGATLEALHKGLCGRFAVAADEAWGDLVALVRELQRNRLVSENA